MEEIIGYYFEVEDYEQLENICKSLYDDKPLTGDRRRDLANAMHNLLYSKAIFVTEEE